MPDADGWCSCTHALPLAARRRPATCFRRDRFVPVQAAPQPADVAWDNTRRARTIAWRRMLLVCVFVALLAADFAAQWAVAVKAEEERLRELTDAAQQAESEASDTAVRFLAVLAPSALVALTNVLLQIYSKPGLARVSSPDESAPIIIKARLSCCLFPGALVRSASHTASVTPASCFTLLRK